MFDIGFWEIVLISIIGLVVLGPQRLPIAIRSVLKWINTAKNMANSVKNEISQELELHEMNEKMIKASKQGLEQIDPELNASIQSMKKTAEDLNRPYQKKERDTASATTSNNTEQSKAMTENTIHSQNNTQTNSSQPTSAETTSREN